MPHHVKQADDDLKEEAKAGILRVEMPGCGHLVLAVEVVAHKDQQGMRFTVCPDCDAKLREHAARLKKEHHDADPAPGG